MFDNNAVTVRKENRLVKLKEQLTKVNEAYERALQAQAWKSSDGMSERSVNNANIAEPARISSADTCLSVSIYIGLI